MLHATFQVIRFELQRTLTMGRVAIWLGLCCFPSLLIGLVKYQAGDRVPDDGLAIMAYFLVPQISCMLGLLIWATPAIGAELESQSWIYLALRPKGRTAIALGKYAVAVLWAASYGLVSAVSVSLISNVEATFRLAAVLCTLVVFSSVCYAALYLFIGAAVYRRATVIAVVYSLILEGVVSWVPATIKQLTVSYRLRSILLEWMALEEFRTDPEMQFLLGNEPAWFNLCVLLIYAVLLLGLALYVVRNREYPVQVET